jgi:hypothetical protein
MNFLEYADEELMMMALADRIAGDLEEVLLTHDTATLVGARRHNAWACL